MKQIKDFFTRTSKGQSAIEYLMTYGWMLLVVAIVGGAIFATVQNNRQECTGELPQTLQVEQQGFGVESFGVGSGGNAQVVLKNNGQDSVTVNTVSVAGTSLSTSGSNTIGVGGSETYTAAGFTNDDSCTEAKIAVDYNMGGLSNQVIEGNVTSKISTP